MQCRTLCFNGKLGFSVHRKLFVSECEWTGGPVRLERASKGWRMLLRRSFVELGVYEEINK